MAGPKHTITLNYPIEHGGQTYKTLELRRPKAGDVRAMGKGSGSDADKSMRLIADLAEVPPAVIDELDMDDLSQVNDWLQPILSPNGER